MYIKSHVFHKTQGKPFGETEMRYSHETAVGRSVGYHIVKQGALGGGTPHRSLISTMLTTVVSNSANHTCRISYISK